MTEAVDNSGYFTRVSAALLKTAREASGLALREVARRAGTSHATLHAYETARKTPSVATFLRILDACGYAVDFELSPRIRWQDGIYRGDELEQVLDLAGQFPAKISRHMNYPVFRARSGDDRPH